MAVTLSARGPTGTSSTPSTYLPPPPTSRRMKKKGKKKKEKEGRRRTDPPYQPEPPTQGPLPKIELLHYRLEREKKKKERKRRSRSIVQRRSAASSDPYFLPPLGEKKKKKREGPGSFILVDHGTDLYVLFGDDHRKKKKKEEKREPLPGPPITSPFSTRASSPRSVVFLFIRKAPRKKEGKEGGSTAIEAQPLVLPRSGSSFNSLREQPGKERKKEKGEEKKENVGGLSAMCEKKRSERARFLSLHVQPLPRSEKEKGGGGERKEKGGEEGRHPPLEDF